MKLSDLFILGIKNTKLYGDLFYKYQDYDYEKNKSEKIAIYSSQQSILGFLPITALKKSSVYSTKNAIIMYRKGKAGTLFTPKHRFWACSENAIPLLLKKEHFGKIDLNIAILLAQGQIYEKSTGKSDNANANWNMVKDIEIDYSHNEELIGEYKKIKLVQICKDFSEFLDKQIKKSVISEGQESKIVDLFHVTSGVRITEQEVYHHEGNLYCITSQTTNEGKTWRADEQWLKGFKKKNKPVIVNTRCLTWTKDGYNAGTLFYRDYKFYPNDHCGVLLPKTNKINLKWLMYVYQQLIYSHVTSKKIQCGSL